MRAPAGGKHDERIQDLRLLYLAHEVEEVFEKLERAFERRIAPGIVKQTLQPLFEGGPGHRDLERELARLNAEVAQREDELTQGDLLQALLDCERLAQGFYQRHVDELSDARLARLFQQLAAEEGGHIKAVERAMALVRGT